MAPPSAPNVIVILTDDQGWDDLGLHGNPWLETPRLDQLGRESVRFSNFYVASVCAPSRASLLTGRHFLRVGVSHVHGGHDYIHPDEVLMPEIFQQAGYRTAMWGKWHSGKTSGYLPWERGFDEAYMANLYRHRNSTGQWNGQPRQFEGWTNDTLVDGALEFMTRDDSRPFFLHLPFLTVHTPLDAPEELIEKYAAKGLSRNLATIYAMLDQMDTAIGRLLDALEASGKAEETLVLFMSDNGPAYSKELLTDEDRALRHRSGYKGQKGSMWENGIKSPLFIRQRGRFQPATVDRLADLCDLLPTLLDCCGIEPTTPEMNFDGRSLKPFLEGETSALSPKDSYIYINASWPVHPTRPKREDEYHPVPHEVKAHLFPDAEHLSLRTETHKLLQHPDEVLNAPTPIEAQVLIHMAVDPKEDVNVLKTQPEIARTLRKRLHAWFEEIKQEPHAYHAPVFQIGVGKTNVVHLCASERISGQLHNQVNSIEGWTRIGDRADYRVEVDQPGKWAWFLKRRQTVELAVSLRIQIGTHAIEVCLADDSHIHLGQVTLQAGEQRLTIETVQAPAEPNPPISLGQIIFEPA